MLDTRVEDIIEDYMNHYEVSYEKAIDLMVEDLNDAKTRKDEILGGN